MQRKFTYHFRQRCRKSWTNPATLESKISHGRLLGINSELKLLTLDDQTEQDEIRDVANELDLNRKQIAELTETVKKGEQTIKEWLQQFLDQRNEARAQKQKADQLERELEAAKNKPADYTKYQKPQKAHGKPYIGA